MAGGETTFLKVKNRAYSKLAAALTAVALTVDVTAGEGSKFPSTYPFHITIEDEILEVTDVSTDTLTFTRAAQGTSAAAHPNKAYVALNITAKSITDLNTAVNFIEKYADYGLAFYGIVTTATSVTHFKVSGLAGMGTGWFKPVAGTPYEIFVVQADAAAPEGESQPVVAYTSSDGTFQHAAFTQQLAVGDEVLIIMPLLASLGTKATAAASGAVTTTDYVMAYIKQLVTLLLNATYGLAKLRTEIDANETKIDTIDAVVDSIIADYLNHATYGLDAIKSLLNAMVPVLVTLDTRTASIVTDYLAHATYGLDAIKSLLNTHSGALAILDSRTATIVTDYLAHASYGLDAIKSALNTANAIIPDLRSNLVRWGQITGVGSATQFTSADLGGLGVDAMHGWYVYVMQADDAAPEGEYRLMTDYTDAGVITHNAFSTGLAAGDRVQLIHPVLYHAFAATRGSGPRSLETLGEEQDAELDVARGTSGAVSVDGGEDNVYNESADTEFVLLELRVDLNNMAEGDTIVFKVYTTEGGIERKVSEDVANTFEGAQDPARPEIIGSSNQVWGREGIRVCAVKSAGTTRTVTAYYRDAKRGS